ncbi:MAG: GNAT family N-acetyltransferase [Deltaproteobacteria bacterium]|nr:GNAT family N-acetyltransferase [Deltaproteobacteria bacterium]
MIAIVPAQPADVERVRSISSEVFSVYGDYASILPRFFATHGVTTYLARRADEAVGFVMLGFLPWNAGEEDDAWIADLLAIAVLPAHQRCGVGKALMGQLEKLIGEMSEWRDLKEIQLTCAAGNEAGLAFFEQHGFRVIDRQHGAYSAGQRAWRLARRLSPRTRAD